MNNGLSDQLKMSFPNIKSISRPLIENQVIKNPYWLVGFVDAEGCFYIKLNKSTKKLQIALTF